MNPHREPAFTCESCLKKRQSPKPPLLSKGARHADKSPLELQVRACQLAVMPDNLHEAQYK